nr:Tn3 family transposase [Ralstonia solanacearum]
MHQLQRAIYSSKVQHDRGRRQDEMIAISGSLTLLTNLVVAWNTQRMQTTVDAWRRKGQRVDEDWLRRMGPAHFAHVNFRGILASRFTYTRTRCLRRLCGAQHLDGSQAGHVDQH